MVVSSEKCPCEEEPDEATLIACMKCDQWYHVECVNLTGLSSKAGESLRWECPRCYVSPFTPKNVLEAAIGALDPDDTIEPESAIHRTVSAAVTTALKKFTSTIEKSTVKNVEKVRKEANKTYSESLKTNLREIVEDKTTTNIVSKVVRQMDQDKDERSKRQCNVIVHNVQEHLTADGKLDVAADKTFVNAVCEIAYKDVEEHFRAGKPKKDEDGKPISRPLVIKLKSEKLAHYYSAEGKGFRVDAVEADEKKVTYWVNRDLCRADREAAYFARVERRKRSAQKKRESS